MLDKEMKNIFENAKIYISKEKRSRVKKWKKEKQSVETNYIFGFCENCKKNIFGNKNNKMEIICKKCNLVVNGSKFVYYISKCNKCKNIIINSSLKTKNPDCLCNKCRIEKDNKSEK